MPKETNDIKRVEADYTIGGDHFVQRPLVLGELADAAAALDDLDFKKLAEKMSGGGGIDNLIKALLHQAATALPALCAAVLKRHGHSIAEARDERAATIAHLLEHLDIRTLTQVIKDFFTFNVDSTLSTLVSWEKIQTALLQVMGMMMAQAEIRSQESTKHSTTSSAPLPEAEPPSTSK